MTPSPKAAAFHPCSILPVDNSTPFNPSLLAFRLLSESSCKGTMAAQGPHSLEKGACGMINGFSQLDTKGWPLTSCRRAALCPAPSSGLEGTEGFPKSLSLSLPMRHQTSSLVGPSLGMGSRCPAMPGGCQGGFSSLFADVSLQAAPAAPAHHGAAPAVAAVAAFLHLLRVGVVATATAQQVTAATAHGAPVARPVERCGAGDLRAGGSRIMESWNG